MGLAASQARFLGITLRKANCEFKSTELAQQRLELTDQMTKISMEYANALDSTKLLWNNEAVCDAFGNPIDMGLSYGLLMMPSAANDFNPYMVSTRSGAIVLSSKYADAAKAAGISMAGGTPSAAGRREFLRSLANGYVDGESISFSNSHDNIITQQTFNTLEGPDRDPLVAWSASAGMGAVPKDKGIADILNINDIKQDSAIGQVNVDWLQIIKGLTSLNGSTSETYKNAVTEVQAGTVSKYYDDNITREKLKYFGNDKGVTISSEDLEKLVANAKSSANEVIKIWTENYENNYENLDPTSQKTPVQEFADNYVYGELGNSTNEDLKVIARMALLDARVEHAQTLAEGFKWSQELEYLKSGRNAGGEMEKILVRDENGRPVYKKDINGNNTNEFLYDEKAAEFRYPLLWAIYEQAKYNKDQNGPSIVWAQAIVDEDGQTGVSESKIEIDEENPENNKITVNINDLFTIDRYDMAQAGNDNIKLGGTTFKVQVDDKHYNVGKYTLVVNDSIYSDAQDIKSMTISDLLSENVVIMARGYSSILNIAQAGESLMKSIAAVFGLGNIGTGLNIDAESNEALNKAFEMVKKKFLSPSGAEKSGRGDDKNMTENGAYNNANNFNRIGATKDSDDGNKMYAALNLSNMVSAFLTYYDNFLRGTDSKYTVGRGNVDGKTNFVTDDADYAYVLSTLNSISNDEKIADFYNELYNNICEHGWRPDEMVLDNEYLESAVKDGRYQLMTLNRDGYFYQQRYNNIGYMKEVKDQDAITRAEADFTTKKAQITFKEDSIDIKTKKLDAEISELNTEINSVQNIISKSIEKTFSMFSS